MIKITKSKLVRAILLIILIIGLPFFLAFYEQLFLSYYQESIADRWARYFVIPFFLIALIYLTKERYLAYRKSESKKLFQTLKKGLLETGIVIIMFFYIVGPIISGAIIFINANIGHQTEEVVEGLIIARRDYNGNKSHEYKLTIKTNSEVLIFQTDTKVIVSHQKGENFRETMNRGSLGILYKK